MKPINTNDTIFALSTPVGGAIAVFRVSGSFALPVLRKIFDGRIENRMLCHGRIHRGEAVLDDTMAVFFKGPHSYTGEDMFEINLHGSYAVCASVSNLLAENGLRRAEPGEFTKRAFLNGKMDLVQADAVMDLILTETERSANAALEQLSGGLSRRIAGIEDGLIDLMSELSAAMDYPEEMEDETLSAVPDAVDRAVKSLGELISNGNCSRILREGARVVILGRPNVGKSSLFNALVNSERAIVTEIAGTTRDVLEEHVNLNGIPLRLVDTAGIHDTDDVVESIGVERALAEAETAELTLLVFDGGEELTEWDTKLLERTKELQTMLVINKADSFRNGCELTADTLNELRPNADINVISCASGEGLSALKEKIAMQLGASESERAIVTNERHIECMSRAVSELVEVRDLQQTDLIANGIGEALMHLGEITGRTVSEEVLDRIFERFCVGK
ncbi:MAG: tRNA uridine-5-carboxymethylaminomethyl(34) synthesis GTPase MnmE [Christensenellaceae bacterium]|nr:tRNA uridine-5-carboxymethylaminomethyl(34) synthesis GTPase MnmE [Christensenellaceae bacterium]